MFLTCLRFNLAESYWPPVFGTLSPHEIEHKWRDVDIFIIDRKYNDEHKELNKHELKEHKIYG